MSEKVKVGVVGCGNISGAYLPTDKKFSWVEITACADLVREKAEEKAAEHGSARACSVEELLADPEIRIVVNLTIPGAHYEVAMAALDAGKCVHSEKPLALTRDEGKKLLAKAKEKGLLVGSAPDTFFGGGHQTCRKLIDDGAIGEPVAAAAFMMCRGHESWHPDPEFYYKPGGGPMFDMGPYYLTALVNMMGPVRRVTGATRITFPERLITSEPKNGQRIKVETPTHIAGVMDFASGAVGTITTSFDVWGGRLPCIEVYGSEGTLSAPDPNGFGGPVVVHRQSEEGWNEVPLTHGCVDQGRGIGVADMAQALLTGRKHRASGDVALHVLDIMQSFHEASDSGKHVELTTTCERPQALKPGLAEGELGD